MRKIHSMLVFDIPSDLSFTHHYTYKPGTELHSNTTSICRNIHSPGPYIFLRWCMGCWDTRLYLHDKSSKTFITPRTRAGMTIQLPSSRFSSNILIRFDWCLSFWILIHIKSKKYNMNDHESPPSILFCLSLTCFIVILSSDWFVAFPLSTANIVMGHDQSYQNCLAIRWKV